MQQAHAMPATRALVGGVAVPFHAASKAAGNNRTHRRLVCQAGRPNGKDSLNSLLSTITALKPPALPKDLSLPSPSVKLSLDFANKNTQTLAFSTLSTASAVIAAVALFVPEAVLETLLPLSQNMGFASYAGLDPTLLRVAGATLIISAAVEYCLQDAAANSRLTSATYQRLMVACVFKSVGYLIAFSLASPVWTPALFLTYPTAAALSIYINISVLLASNNKDGVQTIPNLLPGLVPKNIESWVYSGFVLLYLLTAVACYAPADAPFLFIGETGGASSELIKHTWAPGFVLAAVASINLKDAADRGRLGASTFKRLNLGLAGLEVAYSAVFVSALTTRTAAGDFSGMFNLATSLGIAVFCINQWLYAKK